MSLRIVSGQWRGRKLAVPDGMATRPTADRTRETLYSMLVSRLGSFDDLRVADLFAGSGALGLEALSRGAAHCIFVEQEPAAVRSIRSNISNLRASDRADVRAGSVLAQGPLPAPFDLILLDPPYHSGAGAVALDRLVRMGWIGPASWIALETAADEQPRVKALELQVDRRVGKARISLFRMPAGPD